jgi:hypothetical protein
VVQVKNKPKIYLLKDMGTIWVFLTVKGQEYRTNEKMDKEFRAIQIQLSFALWQAVSARKG